MEATETHDDPIIPQVSTFRHSSSLVKLASALSVAAGEFLPAKKSAENPFFKSSYADLAELIDATRPALAKHGLAVVQFPGRLVVAPEGWRVEISTMLLHSSGEWMRGESEMPCNKKDAQGLGSAETYGRRYAYQAILCLAAVDDDANAATGKKLPQTEAEGKKYQDEFDQRTADQQNIAVYQIQAIDEACKRSGKTEEEIKAYLGLMGETRIEHIKKNQFQEFIKWANGPIVKAGKVKANGKEIAASILQPTDTQKLMRQVFGAAHAAGISENDVKQFAYEQCHVKSMTELTEAQLKKVGEWVVWAAEQAKAT